MQFFGFLPELACFWFQIFLGSGDHAEKEFGFARFLFAGADLLLEFLSRHGVVGSRDELATRTVRLRDAVLRRDGDRVDRVKLRYRSRPIACTVDAGAGHHAELSLRLDHGAVSLSARAKKQLRRGRSPKLRYKIVALETDGDSFVSKATARAKR